MAFVLRKDAPLPSEDLPPFRAAPNAGPARTGDALLRACPLSLLAVGRPLAIYRSQALTVFPGASAHPDAAALGAQDRARLPHPRNVLPRLVLSPRQAGALDRAGRQARQGKVSSASSTRMTNGSKREGVTAKLEND